MAKHHKAELMYHLVLTAHYRKPFWIPDLLIAQAANSAMMKLVEYHNDSDHLHLLIEVSPTISISKSIEIFKTQTSRLMKFHYCRDWDRWSRGYHISTVGAEKEVIKDYSEGISSKSTLNRSLLGRERGWYLIELKSVRLFLIAESIICS